MMTNPAEITVIMAVYNGLPYLRDAVDSVLHQVHRDFCFFIIDDGSDDGTKDYLDGLRDKRICVIRQKNLGQGAARNAGLELARTEFVAIMDADDISLPERLGAQRDFLRQNREIGLVGSRIAYLGADGRRGFSPPLPCRHEDIYADLLKGRHALVNSSIMCRTALLKEARGYRIAGIGEDWDMMLRMGELARLANLDKVLCLVRLHRTSATAKELASCRKRINHSLSCAKRRGLHQPEVSFEEFLMEQDRRPLFLRVSDALDIHALSQYRHGIYEILSRKPLRGYVRVALSSLISPRWTFQRIARSVRR